MKIVYIDKDSALVEITTREAKIIQESLPDIKTWLPISESREHKDLESLMEFIDRLLLLLQDKSRR